MKNRKLETDHFQEHFNDEIPLKMVQNYFKVFESMCALLQKKKYLFFLVSPYTLGICQW